MRIDVFTIFPDYLAPLELSLAGKARDKGLLDVHVHDLRALPAKQLQAHLEHLHVAKARLLQRPGQHAFGAAGRCQIVTRAHTFEDWARGASASAIRRLVENRI